MMPRSASRTSAVADRHALGDALGDVTTAHFHGHLLVERRRRPDLDLDLLGGAVADEQAVHLAHVVDDRLVQLVAGDADRLAVDDAGHRDDGDVGGAAADVDDHVAGRLGDGQAGADGGGDRLVDQVDLAGLGPQRALLHRAALDLRDLGRHADDDARADPHAARAGPLDEVAEHPLGGVEVGDDAVAQRLDGHHVVRASARASPWHCARPPRCGCAPCCRRRPTARSGRCRGRERRRRCWPCRDRWQGRRRTGRSWAAWPWVLWADR